LTNTVDQYAADVKRSLDASLDSGTQGADDTVMSVRRTASPLAVLVVAIAGLTTGCAHDPTTQINTATSSAITTSVRSLPAVTGARTSETKTPVDTLEISMTTALDKSSPDDVASATELLTEAANMAYATRHDTLDAVVVNVYGVDSTTTSSQPTALLAQNTFKTSDLAAGSP
jgi:hypothetical protein